MATDQRRIALTRAVALLTTAAISLFLVGCRSYEPLRSAQRQAGDGIQIEDRVKFLLLTAERAADTPAEVGIIFYPGGLVEPGSYVSLLAPLAADGVPVAILQVPLDLAVFSVRRAEVVLEGDASELAERWVLAGHSLGGAMAARFLARHASNHASPAGLIMLAAYPANNDPLTNLGYPVLSIWASEDGLATAAKREETAALLPADAVVAVIDGGNHAGFGEYGPQKDDGAALLSRTEQHRRVRRLITEWIEVL